MTNRRFGLVAWVFAAVVPLAGLQQAAALDCNRNGIPDDCDVDCRLPGCLQYACGRSDDSQPNGVPDECEGAPTAGSFETTADFTTSSTLINLDQDVAGQLSRSELPSPMPNLWVAASNRDTIVRINTELGVDVGDVVGEYFTAPEGRGGNPSRTSVNLDGEVWVSNRSEGSQFGFGSITRIGVLDGGTLIPPTACEPDNRATFAPPFVYNTCVDRNGDGMITTSNGLIPLPWSQPDPSVFGTVETAEDECIISYVKLNARNARHISVNSDNDVWVGGSHNNNTFDLVDGETGDILETFDVGAEGYGGLIDCNDVLWSVGKAGNPGLFRYDTNQDITGSECCTPDIVADSNNDLEIDEQDQAVETLSPGFIAYINDDDDNLDGTSDMDQSPVGYENDLAEIQLFAGCFTEHPDAWWSLSWPDATPDPDPIKIWFFSDKSDGELPSDDPDYPANAVAGTSIVNYDPAIDNADGKYPWPPPTTVWLEAAGTYDDVNLTFTINPGPNRTAQSQTVKSSGRPGYTIKLRAVMVVEPNPDPNFVPTYSGGCMLSRTEVKAVMQQLKVFGDKIAPGISFDWEPNADNAVIRLQSGCMKLKPFPFADISECPSSFPAGNPRKAHPSYYSSFVVDKYGTTPDALLQCPDPSPPPGEACYDEDDAGCGMVPNVFCDGYKYAQCTINIYFIGGMAASGLQKSGATLAPIDPWPSTPGAHKPVILIGDGARGSASNATRIDIFQAKKTLEHEVGCHYLPIYAFHSSFQSGTCPNDLCINGAFRESCLGLDYSQPVPNPLQVIMEDVPAKLRADTAKRIRQPCQQGP